MGTVKIVNADALDAEMTMVADAIRSKTGGTEPLAWPEGFISGQEAVWEAAAQAKYDQFWNAHQENGNRTDYRCAFAGEGWAKMAREGKFVPKYTIRPRNLYAGNNPVGNMFSYFGANGNAPVDLAAVEMDFSGCTEANATFENSYVKNIVCDFGNCTTMSRTFVANDTDRRGVDNLQLRVTEKLTSASMVFFYAHQLVNLEFFGDSVIAVTGMELGQSCKLSRTSIENVFRVLSDTTSGLWTAFNLTAVNNAFETAPGAADGSTSQAWADLVATKPNWSIVLEDFIPAGGIR